MTSSDFPLGLTHARHASNARFEGWIMYFWNSKNCNIRYPYKESE